MVKKKVWTNFQRIIELFTQKIVTKFSKIWVWDPGIRNPGSGKKPIPDPGSWIQGSKRHRIPDPQHCLRSWIFEHRFIQ
jgi:hypothetical protein